MKGLLRKWKKRVCNWNRLVCNWKRLVEQDALKADLIVGDWGSQDRTMFESYCRSKTQFIGLSDGVSLCRVLGKYKIYVDNRDYGLSPHLIFDGFWEIWITQAFLRILKPGMVAVDIGANLGYYTHVMADVVGPQGKVFAFEPNPEIRQLLQRSLKLNGFFDTIVSGCACSDVSGQTFTLAIPENEPKNAFVTQEGQGSDQGFVGATVTVKTVKLDDFVKDEQQIDFVKIDAEGAERGIWEGMRETLRRNHDIRIVLEFNWGRYSDPLEFLRAIEVQSFPLRHIDFDGRIKAISAQEIEQRFPREDVILFLYRG